MVYHLMFQIRQNRDLQEESRQIKSGMRRVPSGAVAQIRTFNETIGGASFVANTERGAEGCDTALAEIRSVTDGTTHCRECRRGRHPLSAFWQSAYPNNESVTTCNCATPFNTHFRSDRVLSSAFLKPATGSISYVLFDENRTKKPTGTL